VSDEFTRYARVVAKMALDHWLGQPNSMSPGHCPVMGLTYSRRDGSFDPIL
jgi:hypothetical protein